MQGLGLGVLSVSSMGALVGCQSSGTRSGDAGLGPVDAAPDGDSPVMDAGSACADTDVCLDISDPGNAVLQAVDGWGIVDAGFDRLMIVRTADAGADAFAVVSSICPHARCDVDYRASTHDLPCYCHGSLFGLDGSLRRGPALTGLRQYSWEFDGTQLMIHTA